MSDEYSEKKENDEEGSTGGVMNQVGKIMSDPDFMNGFMKMMNNFQSQVQNALDGGNSYEEGDRISVLERMYEELKNQLKENEEKLRMVRRKIKRLEASLSSEDSDA